MNIKIKVIYDGINYHGFQTQPDKITVEYVLKKAIEETVCHEVKLYFGARTDSGVHALGQYVNFYSDTSIKMRNLPRVITFICQRMFLL